MTTKKADFSVIFPSNKKIENKETPTDKQGLRVFTAQLPVLKVVGLNPTGVTAVKSLQIKVCGDFQQKEQKSTFGQNFHF